MTDITQILDRDDLLDLTDEQVVALLEPVFKQEPPIIDPNRDTSKGNPFAAKDKSKPRKLSAKKQRALDALAEAEEFLKEMEEGK